MQVLETLVIEFSLKTVVCSVIFGLLLRKGLLLHLLCYESWRSPGKLFLIKGKNAVVTFTQSSNRRWHTKERWNNQFVTRVHGTKKNFDSIDSMPSCTQLRWSPHWATGRLVASEVIFTGFVVTRVLHTARISKEVRSCANTSTR